MKKYLSRMNKATDLMLTMGAIINKAVLYWEFFFLLNVQTSFAINKKATMSEDRYIYSFYYVNNLLLQTSTKLDTFIAYEHLNFRNYKV